MKTHSSLKTTFLTAASLVALGAPALAQSQLRNIKILFDQGIYKRSNEKNTLSAFDTRKPAQLGFKSGSYGFKVDVSITADDVVLTPDIGVESQNGQIASLEYATVRDLKRLAKANGQQVTTLGEFLSSHHPSPIQIFMNIPYTNELASRVADILLDHPKWKGFVSVGCLELEADKMLINKLSDAGWTDVRASWYLGANVKAYKGAERKGAEFEQNWTQFWTGKKEYIDPRSVDEDAIRFAHSYNQRTASNLLERMENLKREQGGEKIDLSVSKDLAIILSKRRAVNSTYSAARFVKSIFDVIPNEASTMRRLYLNTTLVLSPKH